MNFSEREIEELGKLAKIFKTHDNLRLFADYTLNGFNAARVKFSENGASYTDGYIGSINASLKEKGGVDPVDLSVRVLSEKRCREMILNTLTGIALTLDGKLEADEEGLTEDEKSFD